MNTHNFPYYVSILGTCPSPTNRGCQISTVPKECSEFAQCRPWDRNIFLTPRVVFGGEVRLPDAFVLLHTKDVM